MSAWTLENSPAEVLDLPTIDVESADLVFDADGVDQYLREDSFENFFGEPHWTHFAANVGMQASHWYATEHEEAYVTYTITYSPDDWPHEGRVYANSLPDALDSYAWALGYAVKVAIDELRERAKEEGHDPDEAEANALAEMKEDLAKFDMVAEAAWAHADELRAPQGL